ncbi:MAG: efflux RND transporter periplasmic adaptor subunit, partial [Sedimenticolaceae bacterium]
PRVDPVARTREARLVFTGEAAVAGTPGRIVWYGARSMLPSDYLVRRDGRLGVFVLDTDRARFIDIPGAEDGRPAVLQLAPETLLISEGRQRLVDNDLVNPIPAGVSR